MDSKNWTRQVYQYMVERNIDTKWREEIRKIRRELGISWRWREGGKEGLARLIENEELEGRRKEAEEKSSLALYRVNRNEGRREYVNGSKDSIYFFKVVSGTLIRRHWEDRKGKCYHCDKIGWEEFHVLWECEGLKEIRKSTRLLALMGLPNEGEFTKQDVREKLMSRKSPREHNWALGKCFGEILRSGRKRERVPQGWVPWTG